MKTERIIVKGADDQAGIRQAAQLLRAGQVVAIPTETVYGLAASAYDPEAVKAVFDAKGRPQDNPLIVHIADKEQLSAVAAAIPETAKRCADAFWPGPFTMILPRGEKIPASVSAGLDTVAVRLPSHQIARAIIRAGNLPLAAPSANTSGKPSPTSAAHVLEDLDGKISAVVMGDDCEVGVESTVVDLCSDPPRLLRPGAVTVEELRRVLPDLVVDRAVLAEPVKGQKVASPGMKYKHYAPKTETVLVEGDTAAFTAFVNRQTGGVAICFEEDAKGITCPKLCYGTARDETTLAHEVFSVLRKADELQADVLYVHAPSREGVGLAVYNRLLRAAAFRVMDLKETEKRRKGNVQP